MDIPNFYKRCIICDSNFKCPKVLPCMHVFCRDCLEVFWCTQRPVSTTDSGVGSGDGQTPGRHRPDAREAPQGDEKQTYVEPDSISTETEIVTAYEVPQAVKDLSTPPQSESLSYRKDVKMPRKSSHKLPDAKSKWRKLSDKINKKKENKTNNKEINKRQISSPIIPNTSSDLSETHGHLISVGVESQSAFTSYIPMTKPKVTVKDENTISRTSHDEPLYDKPQNVKMIVEEQTHLAESLCEAKHSTDSFLFSQTNWALKENMHTSSCSALDSKSTCSYPEEGMKTWSHQSGSGRKDSMKDRPLPPTPTEYLLPLTTDEQSHPYADPDDLRGSPLPANNKPMPLSYLTSPTSIDCNDRKLQEILFRRRKRDEIKRSRALKNEGNAYNIQHYSFRYEEVNTDNASISQSVEYATAYDRELEWKERHPLSQMIHKPTYFHLDEFNCPLCKATFRLVYPKSAATLPDCYFLDDITRVEHEKPPCEICLKKDAVSKCMECCSYMCDACSKQHRVERAFLRHHIVNLAALKNDSGLVNHKSDIWRHCLVHPLRDVYGFCYTCCSWSCDLCRSQQHRQHVVEDMVALTKRFASYLCSYECKIKQTQVRHDKANAEIDASLDNYEEERHAQLSSLAETFERLNKALFDAYCDIRDRLDEHYESEKLKTLQLKENNDNFVDSLKDISKVCKAVCDGDVPSYIIGLSDALTQHLLFLESKEPTDLDRRIIFTMEKTSTLPDKDTFKKMLGSIKVTQEEIKREETSNTIKELVELPSCSQRKPSQIKTIQLKTNNDGYGCAPNALTYDDSGVIYVVDDINKKIKSFSAKDGDLLSEIAPEGEHAFVEPWDITIINLTTLAVSDRGAKRVIVIDTKGNVFSCIDKVKSAWGLYYDERHGLFVTDPEKKVIWLFCLNGKEKMRYTAPGNQMTHPQHLAVNTNGDLIVADPEGRCFHLFSVTGEYFMTFMESYFTEPSVFIGIGCLRNGNFLLSDHENGVILEYNCNGECKCVLLSREDGLDKPKGLAIGSNNTILVLDGATLKMFTMFYPMHTVSAQNTAKQAIPAHKPLLQAGQTLHDLTVTKPEVKATKRKQRADTLDKKPQIPPKPEEGTKANTINKDIVEKSPGVESVAEEFGDLTLKDRMKMLNFGDKGRVSARQSPNLTSRERNPATIVKPKYSDQRPDRSNPGSVRPSSPIRSSRQKPPFTTTPKTK